MKEDMPRSEDVRDVVKVILAYRSYRRSFIIAHTYTRVLCQAPVTSFWRASRAHSPEAIPGSANLPLRLLCLI